MSEEWLKGLDVPETNTGTLLPLLRKQQDSSEFSEVERVVLTHFFTNLDRNIYSPTEAMSMPLWSFLAGQYSRSQLPMRRRFLALFDEMKIKAEQGKLPNEECVSLEEMAEQIKSGGSLNLRYFNRRAAGFIDKWGVAYGHASLQDSDTLRFAIEGISQVVTFPLQTPDPNMGAYQEKSSRYVPFSLDGIIIPPEISGTPFENELKEVQALLMEAYNSSKDKVATFIRDNVINRKDFPKGSAGDKAYKSTVDKKALDSARYFLPTGMSTSMAATWTGRVASIHLSNLLAHPLAEVRLIAKHLREEGMALSQLIRHVEPNSYMLKSQEAMDAVMEAMRGDLETAETYWMGVSEEDKVRLLRITPALENEVLAGILLDSYGGDPAQRRQQAVHMTTDEKREVFNAYFNERSQHDLMRRGVRSGTLTLGFLADIGVMRELKRQRVGTLIFDSYRADIGYDIPPFFKDAPSVDEMYNKLMEKCSELYSRIKTEFGSEPAQYACALGHVMHAQYELDPRQLQYLFELRTPPQAHSSFRTLMWKVRDLVMPYLPNFLEHVTINTEGEDVGRRDAEIKAAQRGL